jgi:hypothetical protein
LDSKSISAVQAANYKSIAVGILGLKGGFILDTSDLPDNMMDSEKFLDDFDGIDSPFEEIINDLIKEYGINNFTFDIIKEEDEINYYIDDFKDLILENNITVKYLQDYLWKESEEEIKSR